MVKCQLVRNLLEKLFDANETEVIKPKSLPFDENTMADTIVAELIGHAEGRKQTKDVIRQWHPDKFYQMLHHRIDPAYKDKILRIVTAVSVALLQFGMRNK